jgi:hypothetical protein
MRIYKTSDDGWVTDEYLQAEFIRHMDLLKEFKLFSDALIIGGLEVKQ